MSCVVYCAVSVCNRPIGEGSTLVYVLRPTSEPAYGLFSILTVASELLARRLAEQYYTMIIFQTTLVFFTVGEGNF